MAYNWYDRLEYQKGGMMSKAKITISMDREYVNELMRIAMQRHITRSHVIEEAFKLWKREQMEAALRDGYKTMAKSDKKTAEQNIRLAKELPYD